MHMVMLCFVLLSYIPWQFLLDFCESFTYIIQGYFIGTRAVLLL